MNSLRLQIITQKIFEMMMVTDITDIEFFEQCSSHPIGITLGIKHPETGEIFLGFCNHTDGGLLFYLPEDIEVN